MIGWLVLFGCVDGVIEGLKRGYDICVGLEVCIY